MNYEILTDKLKLKIVEKADAEIIHRLRTNPEVGKFIKRDLNKSLTDIEEFIEERNKSDLFFSIKTLENEFVGTIAIWRINWEKKYAEIGYELFPKFQNKGIMSEALKSIIDFSFDQLGFEHLEALTHKENLNSRKLLEKFGFEFLENKIDDRNLNNVAYGLTHKKPISK